MKKMIRNTTLSFLLFAACLADAGVPPLSVTVSDADGKAAFKGTTNASGTFATANLKPGDYVVQFNATGGKMKGNQYAIVVSAGKTKVAATAVPGEKFTGGGVAMRVAVGAGLNITGQVAAEMNSVLKNGKKMVWIPPQLSNGKPGHWAEEGSAEAVSEKNAKNLSTDDITRRQEHMDNNFSKPGDPFQRPGR